MNSGTALQSPLHDLHVLHGARLIDFHGWILPVQYTSVIDEHQAVRQAAGIFDISHMGQVLVRGPRAFDFLQKMITGDLRRCREKGLGVYGHLCRPNGGVIDDIFVYGTPHSDDYFVVVNSSTHEKDVAWLRENAFANCEIIDLENRAALAIQGPKALDVIRRTVAGVAELPRFAFQRISGGSPDDFYWGCRTGYTGEDGAEFFGPVRTIATLWKQLLENGQSAGLKPCGLGARDTLRLEMGYPLYGNELTEERSSLEANMEWAIKWAKGDFVGRAALEKQKAGGLCEKLFAFELSDRGIPRQGCRISKDGDAAGVCTSGTFSPSLQKGIGLAYGPFAWSAPGTMVDVEIHEKRVPAKVVKLPFYKKS
ncbi:MAG TPA: glycine cleavage system aminomethyltransferase GcvT [Elusimicrobiota bacterium]|nr:glycine cleavage system aminomethyltransferase GcvT [Elusimicrobiota bacterium]